MNTERHKIATSFDARAVNYGRNEWHRLSAERLVALCQLQAGCRVLDAGTGTGFAAIAAGRAVGAEGFVYGVDISAGMLQEACVAVKEAGLTNIKLVQADASQLPHYSSGAFDVVTCAAGLLYMPVAASLREWRRLLKSGGMVAFSTMQVGSPPAGRIFRECAAAFGVSLRDPSEPLGSPSACRSALAEAGFEVADIISETISFSAQDVSLAWEANFQSAAHLDVQQLSEEEQQALRRAYADALARAGQENPGSLSRAGILYALGRR